MAPPPQTRTPRRTLAGVAGLAVAASAVVVAAFAPPAAADNVMPHDPIGAVRSVTASSDGIQLSGWAADPDERSSNVTVVGLVDGRATAAQQVTDERRPRITAHRGTGPTPGFTLDVPVGAGEHTVCLVARTIGGGMDSVLRCVATPLGTTLTPGEVAAHSPQGAIQRARVVRGHVLRVHGWSTDPDYVARRGVVVLYVDGAPAQTLFTTRYASPRPRQAGPRSAFTAVAKTDSGTHEACVWVVNVGFGGNSFLGCRTLDTRGRASTGPVPVPVLNKRVVREAKRHIGQPYVWGATGPKAFDCSGLVLYSYGKFGYATPRISEDQFAAARAIPASRAVPGDLVFYHDTEGDVYHVGIYTGPGMSVAAIDESQGVNWQKIWDPTIVSYGSFTHT